MNVIKKNYETHPSRHSETIDIFKRTGSITKLQKAMGHSSINVSLTYLRGLEVLSLLRGIWLSYNKKPSTWEG
jgi:hypothetical protein